MFHSPIEHAVVEAEANTVSSPITVVMFNTISLQVGSTESGIAKVRVLGTLSKDMPDYSASATPANHFAPLGVLNLANTSLTEFVTLSGTDACANYTVNVEGIESIAVEVYDYTSGKISVGVRCYGIT